MLLIDRLTLKQQQQVEAARQLESAVAMRQSIRYEAAPSGLQATGLRRTNDKDCTTTECAVAVFAAHVLNISQQLFVHGASTPLAAAPLWHDVCAAGCLHTCRKSQQLSQQQRVGRCTRSSTGTSRPSTAASSRRCTSKGCSKQQRHQQEQRASDLPADEAVARAFSQYDEMATGLISTAAVPGETTVPESGTCRASQCCYARVIAGQCHKTQLPCMH